MLYKAIAIILSTLFLATFQMASANAGCGGGGGVHSYKFRPHQRQASLKQSHPRKSHAVAAAKRKAPAVQQASTKTVEPSKAVAESMDGAESKDGAENEVAVAAVEGTCTRFFAETGTTVTVECAKQ